MQATAIYYDPWAGRVRATLQPQRTSRAGQRITVYRWKTEAGAVVDGLRCGFSADRMIAHAQQHRAFSDVVAL